MASSKRILPSPIFDDCHFAWRLEPSHTAKDSNSLLRQIESHLSDNPGVMTIPALLFKAFVYISDYMQNKKDPDSALDCLNKVCNEISVCQNEGARIGYQIVRHSLLAKIYGDILKNESKAKENQRKVKQLTKKKTAMSTAFIDSVRAFALSRLGPMKLDECIEYFQKAVEVCPNETQWLFGLALVYGRKTEQIQGGSQGETNRTKFERNLYEQILKLDPCHVLATLFLAEVLFHERKFPESQLKFERALELAPNSMKVRTRAAKFFRKLKVWGKALEYIEKAEALEHAIPDAMLFHQKAMIYVDKYKANEGGQNLLPGETSEKTSLLERALSILQEAISMSDVVVFGFDRAWVYEELGRLKEADEEYKRLIVKTEKLWCADEVRVFLEYGNFLLRRNPQSTNGMMYLKQAIELAVRECTSESGGQKQFYDKLKKDLQEAILTYEEYNTEQLSANVPESKKFEVLYNLGRLKQILSGIEINLIDTTSAFERFKTVYANKEFLEESVLIDTLKGLVECHAAKGSPTDLSSASHFLEELKELDEDYAATMEQYLLAQNVSLSPENIGTIQCKHLETIEVEEEHVTDPQQPTVRKTDTDVTTNQGKCSLVKDDTTGETSPSSESQDDEATPEEQVHPEQATGLEEDSKLLRDDTTGETPQSIGSQEGTKQAESSPSEILKYDDLIFSKDPVGDGHASTVYCVNFKKGSYKGYSKAAAKKLYKISRTEVNILKRLHHQNIIAFIAEIDEGHNYFIITEFAEHGSLYDYLKNSEEPLPTDLINKWAHQLAIALQYLHEEGVLHRDIKSCNCLICENQVLKLCDFGISRETDESITTTSDKGTHRWMAPEVLDKRKHSTASDIYAMGMVFLEMCTRKVPFYDIGEPLTVAYRVGQYHITPDIPDDCPSYMKILLPRCWDSDRTKRPKIHEVIRVINEGSNQLSSE